MTDTPSMSVLLLLALLGAAFGCATEGGGSVPAIGARPVSDLGLELEAWHVVETPDFTLLSNQTPGEAERSARRLARFADAVRELIPDASVSSRTTALIFALEKGRQYRVFGPKGSAGYMQPSLRGTTMALSMQSRDQAVPILYHEFTHYLMQNERGHDYPLWYHEGLAELLSTVVVREDLATLGLVPAQRRAALVSGDPIPTETLLAARVYSAVDDVYQFYADAWLLVHYLHLHESGIPQKLSRYLRALTRGANPVTAFEENFALAIDELAPALDAHRERVLRRYVRVLEITVPEREHEIEARPVPVAELAAVLGEHLIERGRSRAAGALLRYGLAQAPEDPALLVQLALAEAAQGDFEVAEARAHSLIAKSDSAPAHATLGWVYALRADSLEEGDTQSGERQLALRQARESFEASLARDPDDASIWYGLARTYLEEEVDPGPGIIALDHSLEALPWSVEIHLLAAALRARQGEFETALEHATIASSLATNEAESERAVELLRSIHEVSENAPKEDAAP